MNYRLAAATTAALLIGGSIASGILSRQEQQGQHYILFIPQISAERPEKIDFFSTNCNGLYDRAVVHYPSMDRTLEFEQEYEENLRALTKENDEIGLSFNNCKKPSKRKPSGRVI